MNSETKDCQSCKNKFQIEPEDFIFYDKMKVPIPSLCPDCRNQRRYAWRNERTLYRRDCGFCGKSMVTMYHPQSPFLVYCSHCWWGDTWDTKEFAQDFNFSKSFFEQFKELQLKIPRLALLNKNSINSEFTNHSGDNKDVFLSYECFNCENSLHLSQCWGGIKDSMDTNMAAEGGTLLYGCVSSDSCYNCQFCLNCKNSIDIYYCYDCVNCQNCFSSYNLRNKKYVFENKQLTKEEYQREIEKIDLSSSIKREQLFLSWKKNIKEKVIHRYAQIFSSVKVTGDVISNSKNCKNIYDAWNCEEVKNSVVVLGKELMDVSNVGLGVSERMYEVHAITNSSNIIATHLSYDNSFISYCDSVYNSQNLFGCVGLKKSNYCIFNKQYSKEEYIALKEKIIEHMIKTGEYGEFFPALLSPFGYNETQGQVYMPLSKNEAISNGFKWQDDIPVIRGKETMQSENIPDSIRDVQDNITHEILNCKKCERNYNIVAQELELLRRLNVSLPRECPGCRYLERMTLRPARKLWNRNCMCDQKSHSHLDHCSNKFETPYSPQESEIVYCEECYQKEVF